MVFITQKKQKCDPYSFYLKVHTTNVEYGDTKS